MRIHKRTTLLGLALCLVLMLSLCACRNSNPKIEQMSPESEHTELTAEMDSTAETELVLYSQKEYLLPGGCSIKGVARIENHLMLYGYQNKIPVLGIAEYKFAEDGTPIFSEAKLLPLDTESLYYTMILGLAAGNDGCFYVLTGEHPPLYMSGGELQTNEDYQGKTAVLKYSPEGEQLDCMEFDWQWDSRYGIAVDENSRVYIAGQDFVASFSWQSDIVQSRQFPDGNVCSIAMTSMGAVLSVWEDNFKYYLMESPEQLRELTINNPCDIPTVEIGNLAMCQGLDGEYIISANSQFLDYDIQSNTTQHLYQWDYTDYPDGCEYACRLAENFFACTVGEDFILVTGMREVPVGGKSTVRVALYDMEDSNADGIISSLNSQGGKYKYEKIEYSAGEEQRLFADIITGGKIDLLVFNNNLDVSSENFEDLYQYIDADPDMSRDDFIPGILDALSDNEQLHELWESADISTMAARTADVEGRENISPLDYQEILAANPQYEAVFQHFMDKENLLKWVAEAGLVKYVDWESGKCSFDEASFSDMLAWCSMMGAPVEEGSDTPDYDISQVVLSLERISSPVRLKAIHNNFGQDFTFVGFPTGGKGLSYFTCSYNGSLAIPSNSSNKDGAWAYIKSRLLADAQYSINYGLPTNKQALIHQAQASLNTEELEKLLALAESTTSANRFSDQMIKDIILACGRAYLFGDKTLEETVTDIQSRASIYLSEQYG